MTKANWNRDENDSPPTKATLAVGKFLLEALSSLSSMTMRKRYYAYDILSAEVEICQRQGHGQSFRIGEVLWSDTECVVSKQAGSNIRLKGRVRLREAKAGTGRAVAGTERAARTLRAASPDQPASPGTPLSQSTQGIRDVPLDPSLRYMQGKTATLLRQLGRLFRPDECAQGVSTAAVGTLWLGRSAWSTGNRVMPSERTRYSLLYVQVLAGRCGWFETTHAASRKTQSPSLASWLRPLKLATAV